MMIVLQEKNVILQSVQAAEKNARHYALEILAPVEPLALHKIIKKFARATLH